jgi:CdiI immunity protein
VKQPYPYLANFLGGWFHQDFDLEGETVGEVVRAFARVSNPQERQNLLHDIDRFAQSHGADLDRAFKLTFNPDIDPCAFAGSTADFLQDIARTLRASGPV